MNSYIVFFAIVAAASAQMYGSNMGAGTNFNLGTPQGILGFLNMEGIDPSSLVTSNCIVNGNPCSSSGGQPCCLSPVFACQSNPLASGANQCLVVPGHVNHLPQIRQIVQTFGVSTENPIM